MERRRKLRLGDKEFDAIEIPFQTGAEHWNEYLLNDGSVLKMKQVATQIFRLEGEYDGEGNPRYIVKSTNVLSVSASDDLMRKKGDE